MIPLVDSLIVHHQEKDGCDVSLVMEQVKMEREFASVVVVAV
jgi:hypothetical protein